MKIKIFGERNTSTNALQQLLLNNSSSYLHPGTMEEIDKVATDKWNLLSNMRAPARFMESIYDDVFDDKPPTQQWKHAATCFEDVADFEGTHIVFTVRHPMSWLLALHKNPYHSLFVPPASFSEFIDSKWKVLRRDRLGELTLSPVSLYEEKIRSYIDLAGKLDRNGLTYSVLKFEDLVLNQKGALERLVSFLDGPNPRFAPLTSSTKSDALNLDYYMTYYGEERWKDEIDASVFGRVKFDSNLMRWLNYD